MSIPVSQLRQTLATQFSVAKCLVKHFKGERLWPVVLEISVDHPRSTEVEPCGCGSHVTMATPLMSDRE